MKILCQSAEIEKDMQDLVNLFYKEEDCPFSVEHAFSQDGEKFQSKIYIGSGDKRKEYTKDFVVSQNLSDLLKKKFDKKKFQKPLV